MRSLREKCSQQRKNARKGSPGIGKDRAHTNRLLWSTSWINKTKRNWGEHNWKRSAHFRRVVVVGAGTCFEPSIEGWMSFCVRWSVTVWPWETSAVGARSRTTGTLCRGTGTVALYAKVKFVWEFGNVVKLSWESVRLAGSGKLFVAARARRLCGRSKNAIFLLA